MQETLFHTHRPAPPLDRYIELMWYWTGAPGTHAKDRLLPTGNASLVINLAEDEIRDYRGADDSVPHRLPGSVLIGAYSRYSVIDTREQWAVMGVAFRPGGMWPFFDPAADEIHTTSTSRCRTYGARRATLCANGYSLHPRRARGCDCWKPSCSRVPSGLCSGVPRSTSRSRA